MTTAGEFSILGNRFDTWHALSYDSAMKTGVLLALLLTNLAFAGLDIPRSMHRLEDLEEAKAEAAAKGEPLVILYTHTGAG